MRWPSVNVIVTPWPGFEDKWKKHGDGLSELLKHDSQNRFRTIMVAPDFPDNMPWFVDHASDPKRRHETYMMKVVLPFVDSVLKIKRPQRDLIGFSKSGYGAVRLLRRRDTVRLGLHRGHLDRSRALGLRVRLRGSDKSAYPTGPGAEAHTVMPGWSAPGGPDLDRS